MGSADAMAGEFSIGGSVNDGIDQLPGGRIGWELADNAGVSQYPQGL